MPDDTDGHKDATPVAAPGRRQVLLIVDDEPDTLASLESLLSYSLPDVKVITAASGAKGMVIARANVLDMVLSDLRMSKMDGIEFLRQARVVQADIPMVIMATGNESEFAKRAVEVAGLKLVVPKPFNLENLVALISSYLHDPARRAETPVAPSFREDGSDHASRAWARSSSPAT